MNKLKLILVVAVFAVAVPTAISAIDKSNVPNAEFSSRALTDCQAKEADRLVDESRDAYRFGEDEPRNCPCPYDEASDGKRCGLRAAYIKPLGERPLCSRDDVGIDNLNKACPAAGV